MAVEVYRSGYNGADSKISGAMGRGKAGKAHGCGGFGNLTIGVMRFI